MHYKNLYKNAFHKNLQWFSKGYNFAMLTLICVEWALSCSLSCEEYKNLLSHSGILMFTSLIFLKCYLLELPFHSELNGSGPISVY